MKEVAFERGSSSEFVWPIVSSKAPSQNKGGKMSVNSNQLVD